MSKKIPKYVVEERRSKLKIKQTATAPVLNLDDPDVSFTYWNCCSMGGEAETKAAFERGARKVKFGPIPTKKLIDDAQMWADMLTGLVGELHIEVGNVVNDESTSGVFREESGAFAIDFRPDKDKECWFELSVETKDGEIITVYEQVKRGAALKPLIADARKRLAEAKKLHAQMSKLGASVS